METVNVHGDDWDGAHQLRNDMDASVRVLMVSTKADVEIAVYPDSDKIGVMALGIAVADPEGHDADLVAVGIDGDLDVGLGRHHQHPDRRVRVVSELVRAVPVVPVDVDRLNGANRLSVSRVAWVGRTGRMAPDA